MREMRTERHIADVRVTEKLDALCVTPRDRDAIHELVQDIKTRVGPIALRVTANGIMIPSLIAHRLSGLFNEGEFNWTMEARKFSWNRARARSVHERLFNEVNEIRQRGVSYARGYLSTLHDIDRLDDHQVINVAAMTLPDGYGVCVFDEQGVGKTVTCIYALDVLVGRDEVDLAMIVAPKSMLAEWPKDLQTFRGDVYRVSVLSGTRREKLNTLAAGADVFITNFETAVQLESELRAELGRRQGRAVLVVDESFFIKSMDARRTRALRHLREWCSRAFVLCGTPAPNSPQDLVEQFNIVDFGITFDGVQIPEDRAAAAVVVRNAMDERGLFVRHLKAEVLPHLPAKRFSRVHVPMASDQLRLYEGALRNLILDLNSTDEAGFRSRIASFFAQRSALLQICSAPQNFAPNYEETPGKLAALDHILEELIVRRREKVVVWSYYTAAIDALVARYSCYSAIRYDGTIVDVGQRRELVRRFQEDDETMVFVGNPAAAGAGLTLHRARYAIYESLSSQAAQYLQSLDRIHRRGQQREVEIIVLLCDGSIEVAEYERLLWKERAAQDLLGDTVTDAPTRDDFLKEAQDALRVLCAAQLVPSASSEAARA